MSLDICWCGNLLPVYGEYAVCEHDRSTVFQEFPTFTSTPSPDLDKLLRRGAGVQTGPDYAKILGARNASTKNLEKAEPSRVVIDDSYIITSPEPLTYDQLYWKYVNAVTLQESWDYFDRMLEKVNLQMQPGNGSWVKIPDPSAVVADISHSVPIKSAKSSFKKIFAFDVSILLSWSTIFLILHFLGVIH